MKEICLDIHVHMLADDTAQACERMAEYLVALAAVHRGQQQSTMPNVEFIPPVSIMVRPVNLEAMN